MTIKFRHWSGCLLAAMLLFFGTGLHRSVEFSADQTEALQQYTDTFDYLSLYSNLPVCLDERFSSGQITVNFSKLPRSLISYRYLVESVQSAIVEVYISRIEYLIPSFDIRTAIFPFHYFW